MRFTLSKIPIVFLLIMNVLSGCGNGDKTSHQNASGTDTAWWPIFRGNNQLSGNVEESLPDSLHHLWTFKTGDDIVSTPVIGEGLVFVGSSDGLLYALDFSTGDSVWAFDTGSPLEASPLVLDKKVYIGSMDGELYALDALSGTLKWTYKTRGKIIGSANWVLSADGTKKQIVVGSYDSKMHCVDPETGELIWSYDTKNFINGAPAVYQNSVIFGGCDALLHRVSGDAGESIVQINVKSYVAGSPSVSGSVPIWEITTDSSSV